MPRRALAALGALALAARLSAQETAPVTTAPPPEAFELDRAGGPLAFDVRFQLVDKDEARLQVRFDEVDEPGRSDGKGEKAAKGDGEHEILALDFQPFEGARFVLSRSTRRQSLVSSALLQVPEPKGLEFQLHFELPKEGGLSVTLPDGMPVVVAKTPRARRMRVEFAASGGVLAFTATKPERAMRSGPNDYSMMSFGEEADGPTAAERARRTLGPAFTPGLPSAPAIKEVRTVDRQEVAGGILERHVIAFEDGIESPLVVARPTADTKRPALLCIAGGPKGNADEAVLHALAEGIAHGRTVAAFELIGAGERRQILPHDALRVLELELVGLSSFDGATVEALQVLKWTADRADVDAADIKVAGAGAGAFVAERIAAADPSHLLEVLGRGPADLTDEAVHVGDDYLHLRFDSCQLDRARERREVLGAPDRTIPLASRMEADRVGPAVAREPRSSGILPGFWSSHEVRKHVTIVTSDRGNLVAIEERASRLPALEDEDCFAIDPAAFVFGGATDFDVGQFFVELAKARGPDAEPPRVFADGAVAIPLLAVVVREKIALTAFTASHALPSFELLLKRPHEAHRAEPELGVLTQGMPEWMFVPDALTRWEIEDAVLELIGRGVAVDWQDPVDALRRPLSRHDRLAMWPRVRHAKFAR
jgi:hypothetical protein